MIKRSIFVLGDSISIHYGPFLKELLGNEFFYDRKRGLEQALEDLDKPIGANGGDSRQVLDYLKDEYRTGIRYDVLLINCGLHDIRVDLQRGSLQVPLDEYTDNIKSIVNLAIEISKVFIWVDTTPVIDKIHNSRSEKMHRFSSDLNKYRIAANEIMHDYDIPIIRLYDFTNSFGTEAFIDHVHFTEEVRKKQAEYLRQNLLGILTG